MFTGIIEELGTVERVTRGRVSAVIAIRAEHILSDLKIGDSVAVNGVCLTATGSSPAHGFTRRRDARDPGPLRPGGLRPGQPGESGAGHGGQRALRRAHRGRARGTAWGR